ncbi:MAG: hypothetical protein ACI9TH_000278 [Kiritimatiellia bacterium]
MDSEGDIDRPGDLIQAARESNQSIGLAYRVFDGLRIVGYAIAFRTKVFYTAHAKGYRDLDPTANQKNQTEP